MSFTHETMLSPFTWRYGSEAMRVIWSEVYGRKLWRRLWVALAQAQHEFGLISAEQVEDLRAHQDQINLARAHQIESEIKHDLMAEVKTFAEQCPIGGGIIHLGATSMDIEDNATAIRLGESLDLLIQGLWRILETLVDLIETHADHVCIAFTHLQPAALTTLGYRLANYGQDLLAGWEHLVQIRAELRGKGFKGAVGTSATYEHLLQGTGKNARDLETRVMSLIGLEAFTVATQTYPRRQDWRVLCALADVGMSAYRLAFDVRLLQSPPIGEWGEPFGMAQVGSSAMPFKRNPINAENVDSLARYLASLPSVAWDNAAHSLLERTLDDSANRRVILPEGFLAADEILARLERILRGLRLDDRAIQRNLNLYGTFSATERLLMEAAQAGGDRQTLHEIIREHSLAAWEVVGTGSPNPLIELLAADPRITRLVPAESVRRLMRLEGFIGDAPQRARELRAEIRAALGG